MQSLLHVFMWVRDKLCVFVKQFLSVWRVIDFSYDFYSLYELSADKHLLSRPIKTSLFLDLMCSFEDRTVPLPYGVNVENITVRLPCDVVLKTALFFYLMVKCWRPHCSFTLWCSVEDISVSFPYLILWCSVQDPTVPQPYGVVLKIAVFHYLVV